MVAIDMESASEGEVKASSTLDIAQILEEMR